MRQLAALTIERSPPPPLLLLLLLPSSNGRSVVRRRSLLLLLLLLPLQGLLGLLVCPRLSRSSVRLETRSSAQLLQDFTSVRFKPHSSTQCVKILHQLAKIFKSTCCRAPFERSTTTGLGFCVVDNSCTLLQPIKSSKRWTAIAATHILHEPQFTCGTALRSSSH